MDSQRFDQLIRSLATASTRRRLLGLLAAGFGSSSALRTPSAIQAAPTCNGGPRCGPGEICCPAIDCVSSTDDACGCDQTPCDDCQHCSGGSCVAVANGTSCPDDGNPCTS